MPKCWGSRGVGSAKVTLTRCPWGTLAVAVQPLLALVEATFSVVASTLWMSTEPALPAWNVAEAPMAGALPLTLVAGSQVSFVWVGGVVVPVAAKEGAAK